MDLQVDCPSTVCEFAAGLHRPKFDPLVTDPPNLTKRSVKRDGEEIEVPFHERSPGSAVKHPKTQLDTR